MAIRGKVVSFNLFRVIFRNTLYIMHRDHYGVCMWGLREWGGGGGGGVDINVGTDVIKHF